MKAAKTASAKKTAVKAKTATKKFKTVDEYENSLTGRTKAVFKELRKTIQKAVPHGEEMISYNMASVKIPEGGLIWYAGWKEHISMYPWNDEMVAGIKGLDTYATSRGTIKFPLDKPLPADLIGKIVKHRIKQVRSARKEAQ